MLSVINKKFWRKGMALGGLIMSLWPVCMAFAQETGKNSDIVVINFPVQGWYLVSVPLAATDSTVGAIFPTAFGVFGWDSDNNRYVRPATIQIGRGYWVLMGAPATVVVSGTRFSQFSGHYRIGWHLIGSLIDSVNFANPNDTPDRSVLLPIFAWDAGGQRYVSRNFIEQSYGHWMFILQECDLIVKAGSTIIEKGREQILAAQLPGAPPPPPFPIASESESQIFPITMVNEESRSLQPVIPPTRIEFPDPLQSIASPQPSRAMPEAPAILPTPQPEPDIPARSDPVVHPQPVAEVEPARPAGENTIALQINTVPIHCQVIVDDKMVGQSPLTVYVDRFSDHVIQISRDGYAERIRLLDHHFLGNESTHILLEKLELKK